jgi:hypothetical protein
MAYITRWEIQREFIAVDARFGEVWLVPYEEVQKAISKIIRRDRTIGPDESGDMVLRSALRHRKYILLIRDMALRILRQAEE